MAQSFVRRPFQAPSDATYVLQKANANLPNAQNLSALASGYMKVTTATGVITSQAVPIPVADGGTNGTTYTTNGVLFFDGTRITSTAAGTNGTVLHGNTGAAPTFSAVSLTSDVTGVLPITNGGTNNSTAYTAGSVIFSNGTSLTQNNSKLFWDNTNLALVIGGASTAAGAHVLFTTGQAIFNQNAGSVSMTFHGSTTSNLLVVDGTNNRVDIGTGTQGQIATFQSTQIIFNQNQASMDFQVKTLGNASTLFVKGSNDRVGIRTSTPGSALDVRGGLSMISVTKTANYTISIDDFMVVGNPAANTTITFTLPVGTQGQMYWITNQGGTAGVVTIAAGAGETINGGASINIPVGSSTEIIHDTGTNWLQLQ